jgi:fatty acid amide hydrolase 2
LLSSLHQEIVIGIGRCTDHLSSLGSKVEQFTAVPEIFDGLNAFQYWSALMSSEKKEPFSVTIRDGSTPFSSFWHMLLETTKSIAGISIHTFPAMLLSLAEIFVARTPSLTAELAVVAKRVKSVLCEYLKGNKVLIIPSLPSYAPLHNESILRIFDTANTSFFNVAELPATAVPLGLDARGMPIGLQVIAAPGNDYLTIAVAKALQKGGIAKWMAPKSHM